MQITESETNRIFKNSTQQGKCILFGGKLDKDGYGNFFFRKFNRRVHRVIYWVNYGNIPAGMVVHHTCRNRNCINIDHLRLATARENSLRESASKSYLNSLKTHCPKGHPFDRKYGAQRYCSICQSEKTKRLRAKWAAADTVGC